MRTAKKSVPLMLLLGLVANAAWAIDPEGNPDGFNPAAELNRIGEAQRIDRISRQIDLNRRMLWSSGYGPRPGGMFEPWQRVPGDVWGYQSVRPVEQPIGHESAQTGPNRWTYRPIYAAPPADPVPVAPRAGARAIPAKPPVIAEPRRVFELPKPSDARPEDFVPPGADVKKAVPAGRREF